MAEVCNLTNQLNFIIHLISHHKNNFNNFLSFFFQFNFRALFGYEGQSNCLKLISNGDGGLIELADELNSGKIMYAFVSVQDPKNSLTKYLLINWQVSIFSLINDIFFYLFY